MQHTVINNNSYFSVDSTFESLHGSPHIFVGGHMYDIGVSPNDPTFFMHHCFVDYIWDEFRMKQQSYYQREQQYPGDTQTCNDNHKADAVMKPFGIKNREGLNNTYTYDLFFYQPRPTCTPDRTYCYSEYLFCDTKNYKCLSKVKAGGNCAGFEGTEICYKGDCKSGVCKEWY